MINRTEAPQLIDITHVDFTAPVSAKLNEEVMLYHMKEVPNETARFDLYFDAGKCRAPKGLPGFVNGLLLTGTATKTSVAINNEINALGGFLESGISVENSVVTIYCLRENLIPIFDIITDAIANVAFIEKEVAEYLSDGKQRMKISQEKVSYLAQRKFQQNLFASNPVYSTPMEISDFDDINIDHLKEFHRKHYLNGLQKVVVVGDIDENDIAHIKRNSEQFLLDKRGSFDGSLANKPGQNHVSKEGALQSAIRVGRTLFNKTHEDYLDFLILNTILGDYFGSRLMSNIREDKGYTYGIGTMLAELNETGYFLIATEVGTDVRENTLHEIKFELERLQNELIPEEELQLVKNYMLGQLLKSADGPYAMTDLFLSAELHGKDLDFYNLALTSIQSITAERLQELAKTYFKWEDMTIVSAG